MYNHELYVREKLQELLPARRPTLRAQPAAARPRIVGAIGRGLRVAGAWLEGVEIACEAPAGQGTAR